MTNDRNAKTVKLFPSQIEWINKQRQQPNSEFGLSRLIRTLLAAHIAAVEVDANDSNQE